MMTTVVVMVLLAVVVVEGGKGERVRGQDAREAKGESCPAWTCASLHGRPGDSLSARWDTRTEEEASKDRQEFSWKPTLPLSSARDRARALSPSVIFLSLSLSVSRLTPVSFSVYQGNRVSDPYFFYRAESPDFPRSALVQIRLDDVLDRCKRRRRRETNIIIHRWKYTAFIYWTESNMCASANLLKFWRRDFFEFINEHLRGNNDRTQSAESTHLTVITCVYVCIFSYQSAWIWSFILYH